MADGGDGEEPVYYVISDLHIGGDEQLEHVEFLEELLELLERLETTDENAELIVNGDAFGLWEFTAIDGPAKFDVLVDLRVICRDCGTDSDVVSLLEEGGCDCESDD